MCRWSSDTSADFNFTVTQGPTSTLSTGPIRDHTKKTGEKFQLTQHFLEFTYLTSLHHKNVPSLAGVFL